MNMPRYFLPKLSALALAIAAVNTNAATCTPTNVLYTQGSTINVPCIEIDNQVYQAHFKLLSTTPEHILELQTLIPADANTSGTRANVSEQNGKVLVNIPLLQSIEGKLYHPQLEFIGEDAESGKYRFKLDASSTALLDPSKDVSRLVFRFGSTNTAANFRADKVYVCRNGKTLNIAEPAVKASDTLGACGTTTTPAAAVGISAAVLKVKRVEITGTGSGKMNLDISGDLDLVKVINGESQLLGEIVLPADTHIGQVRLILDAGSYVIQNGEQYDLTVPSGEQTGLKIVGDWTTVGGQMTEVQLDLGLEDIRFNKGQGEYRLKPVVSVEGITEVIIEEPIELDKDAGILNTGSFDGGYISSLTETATDYILSSGNKLTLVIPKGAINPETAQSLFIEEEVRELDLSSNFSIEPDKTPFNELATITLRYNSEFLHPSYSEDELVIFQNGLPINSTVNASQKSVTGEISHLSYYRVCHSSCAFTDLATSNENYISFEKSVDDIYLLCGLGVLKGYIENDVKLYKPAQDATLLEVLRVLIYTSDYQRVKNINSDPWYEFFLDDAEDKLNLTVLPDEYNRVVSNSEAISYASGLLGVDILALTPGLPTSGNITRAQLAELGAVLIKYTWMGEQKIIGSCDIQSENQMFRSGTCLGNITSYDGVIAAEYAVNNYDRAYGNGASAASNENPFSTFAPSGYNCTHFASQSILAGLVGSSSAWDVYNSRSTYADKGYSANDWYFESQSDRATGEWAGANAFHTYVTKQITYEEAYSQNGKTLTGMHFEKVTEDSPTQFMDYRLIQVGDIIFADWPKIHVDTDGDGIEDEWDIDKTGTTDGIMDHTMIVTGIQTWRPGYNEIRLTYQSSNKTNIGLGDINEDYLVVDENDKKHFKALFYVYRPKHFVK